MGSGSHSDGFPSSHALRKVIESNFLPIAVGSFRVQVCLWSDKGLSWFQFRF
jgi:hypothetical protein